MHAKIDLKIMIEGTHELICLRDEKGGGGRDIRWRVIVLEGSGGVGGTTLSGSASNSYLIPLWEGLCENETDIFQ